MNPIKECADLAPEQRLRTRPALPGYDGDDHAQDDSAGPGTEEISPATDDFCHRQRSVRMWRQRYASRAGRIWLRVGR
ncbi:hypothetical protein GCM10027569_41060 [Flindersiella endophytica]